MPNKNGGLLRTLRVLIAEKSGGLCWYCGKTLAEITLDHLIPGAGDHVENLVPCCQSCNSAKSDRSVEEFRRTMCHPPFHPKQISFLTRHGIKIPAPDYIFWFERRAP